MTPKKLNLPADQAHEIRKLVKAAFREGQDAGWKEAWYVAHGHSAHCETDKEIWENSRALKRLEKLL